MTPAQFAAALDATGWTDREAARQFGCDKKAIYRYRTGIAVVPSELAGWLRRFQFWAERNPVPDNWKTRK